MGLVHLNHKNLVLSKEQLVWGRLAPPPSSRSGALRHHGGERDRFRSSCVFQLGLRGVAIARVGDIDGHLVFLLRAVGAGRFGRHRLRRGGGHLVGIGQTDLLGEGRPEVGRAVSRRQGQNRDQHISKIRRLHSNRIDGDTACGQGVPIDFGQNEHNGLTQHQPGEGLIVEVRVGQHLGDAGQHVVIDVAEHHFGLGQHRRVGVGGMDDFEIALDIASLEIGGIQKVVDVHHQGRCCSSEKPWQAGDKGRKDHRIDED